MSTATVEVGVGDPGAGLYFSASSVRRFSGCEEHWLRALLQPKEERDIEAKSEPLLLGTLWHRLKGAWRAARSWQAEWIAALYEVDEDAAYELDAAGNIADRKGWEAPSYFLRARKIMDAFVLVYGETPSWPIVAGELPFDLPLPGVRGARVRGWIDGIERQGTPQGRDGGLVVVEEKTMGRWGPERRVAWDPQTLLYAWAANQLFPVEGVLFEATSTYDYKPSKPPEEATEASRLKDAKNRFRPIFVPYDERAVERNLDNIRRIARRAKELLRKPELAVRSVGPGCDYCPFHKPCLTPWET